MYVLMLVTTIEFGHILLTRIGDVKIDVISTATHCMYISVSTFLMLTEVTNDSRSDRRAAACCFFSSLRLLFWLFAALRAANCCNPAFRLDPVVKPKALRQEASLKAGI